MSKLNLTEELIERFNLTEVKDRKGDPTKTYTYTGKTYDLAVKGILEELEKAGVEKIEYNFYDTTLPMVIVNGDGTHTARVVMYVSWFSEENIPKIGWEKIKERDISTAEFEEISEMTEKKEFGLFVDKLSFSSKPQTLRMSKIDPAEKETYNIIELANSNEPSKD